MKPAFILLCLYLWQTPASAQILKRVTERAKQKVENKIGEKVETSIDNATDGKKKSGSEGTADKEPGEATTAKRAGIKSYSKFDFVPGEKIVFAEDFSQDAIGEFPLKWNTNGSGEVMTIEKVPGKWLNMTAGTLYQLPYEKKLPDNFSIEFDLLVQTAESMSVPEIAFQLDQKGGNVHYPIVHFAMQPSGGVHSSQGEQSRADRIIFDSYLPNGTKFLDGTDQLMGQFERNNGNLSPIHVAIWVQKQRFRAWINEEKVYDLPKGVPTPVELSELRFNIGSYGGEKNNYQYYLSNLKIAEALPDTRSKLLTEGRWSTNGILFDVASDRIQPSSYGVLKEIAATLKENSDLRVKIIGHTDSDGDDAKNMDLSKRRAAAVKSTLSSEFGIDGARLETDGMGESKPVADNKTPEAKAQNRRVEFVKL